MSFFTVWWYIFAGVSGLVVIGGGFYVTLCAIGLTIRRAALQQEQRQREQILLAMRQAEQAVSDACRSDLEAALSRYRKCL